MTWRDDVARWALFASLALLLGVVGIRLLVLPRVVDPRVERRVHLLGTLGAVAAVNAGIVGFVIRSANALQVSGVDLLYADLSPFAESTRFGIAFLVTTLGFGACLTILAVAWVLDRPGLRWPAFLLALALVWGYPLSGHQATEPNASVVGQVADWVHLVSAMLWAGGVLTLAVVVWPLAPDLRRAAFLRFSRIAIGLVAVLVVAGTVVAIERLPAVSDLWETSYGRMLLVKIGLVLVALAWGGVHHTFVRPRLERGERTPGVGRSLLGESAVAMAVLLAAAVLVNGAPPPVEPDAEQAAPRSAGVGLKSDTGDVASVPPRARRDLRRRGLPRPAPRATPARRRARRAHPRSRAARRSELDGRSTSFVATCGSPRTPGGSSRAQTFSSTPPRRCRSR